MPGNTYIFRSSQVHPPCRARAVRNCTLLPLTASKNPLDHSAIYLPARKAKPKPYYLDTINFNHLPNFTSFDCILPRDISPSHKSTASHFGLCGKIQHRPQQCNVRINCVNIVRDHNGWNRAIQKFNTIYLLHSINRRGTHIILYTSARTLGMQDAPVQIGGMSLPNLYLRWHLHPQQCPATKLFNMCGRVKGNAGFFEWNC